jgi:pimeloyl-ACP methyl ester carboxylesterase
MMVRLGRFVSVVAAVALVGAACGGEDASEAATTTLAVAATTTSMATTTTLAATTTTLSPTTTTVVATTTAPPEAAVQTVEVNGALLAYECRGEGSPTVLVDRGLGGATAYSPDWNRWGESLDGIAELTHVCIYGRRGTGGSDPLPKDSLRTTTDQVDDLDGLIVALDLETPLVLMGHSIAGYNLRVFTDRYPEKVAGLIFVDATHPDIDLLGDDVPGPTFPEYLDFLPSAEQVDATDDFGDLPLYVLTASETVAALELWGVWQEELAALSTNSRHKTATSGHEIFGDDPRSVVGSVRAIIKMIG